MEIDELLAGVRGSLRPPADAVTGQATNKRHIEVIVRNSRRNGQPARLIVRYVNGAPPEGLPSRDTNG